MNKETRYLWLFLLVFLTISPIARATENGWINIVEEGASNKGEKCTAIIRATIEKASRNGGGTIYFPPGEYLTGALELKSNITLHLDAGAVLKFSTDFDDYLPFVKMRWEGTVMKNFSPLIYANNAENIAIVGRGKIDGQGKAWWTEMYRIELAEEEMPLTKYQKLWKEQNNGLETAQYYQRTMNLMFFRPPLFQAFKSKNILIEGITIVNAPFWTINPAFCENVTITGVTIFNPPSPNTDGINPTSCRNVHISNCHISVGDDCITIKSGRDMNGREWATPAENITITNTTMLSGHGGIVIGSETSGGIKKVTISNCIFDGTNRGIRLKSARGRGGIVEEIRVSNIVMKNIKNAAIVFNLYYDKGTNEESVTERTPVFRNIHISNLTATNVNKAGMIRGISEMPVQNLSFSNINIEAKEGFEIHTAENIEFHDVKVTAENGPSFEIEDSHNIILDNVKSDKPLKDEPFIKIKNVFNMMVHSNFPMIFTDTFLEADGLKTNNVFLSNNVFTNVKNVIKRGDELNKDAIID